jgi:hypothetical protein
MIDHHHRNARNRSKRKTVTKNRNGIPETAAAIQWGIADPITEKTSFDIEPQKNRNI